MKAKHESIASAESSARAHGYDITKGSFIDMGEGYEHIWVWEYIHPHANKKCRIADLRWAQYKIKDGDTIPRIVGFVQLSEISTT